MMNRSKVILFSLLVSIIPAAAYAQNSVQEQQSKYGRMLRLIDSYYVDSTKLDELTEKAIVHMLGELDPHSVYISKKDVDKMNEPLQGSFDGIGISFSVMRDTLMVVQTIAGGPSEKVGLRAGDRILYVDNEMIAGIGLTNQMVFDRLRGPKGTKVKVSILRKGEKELLNFEITRDKIPIYSLDASYMLDKHTCYIKLNRFAANTNDEFEAALAELQASNKVENLVLDLRGNGGGFLNQAHEITGQFLERGKMIVYTEGLRSPKKTYESTREGKFSDGKLVVLIDEGSASASEIVSGAIQDWDRGILVGRRSFGKGLVQQPFYLTDGSMVRLTTAHYYTPSGRCIQKPYDEGSDAYRDESRQRLSSGELFNKDSIHVNDSEVYKTLVNKRNVYAGGGVVPDIFVPLDTSSNYMYYNKVSRLGVVNDVVETYIDENRNELKSKYETFADFNKNYEVPDSILEKIWSAAEKKDIARDDKSIEFVTNHAKLHIKARIGRDLFNKTSHYYEIVNEEDDAIDAALEIINDSKRYDNILHGKYSK